jgi:aryl-alcohol dehydrogenase-like predicted oxidoreductase
MKMDRRQFLVSTVAGAGGMLLGSSRFAAAKPAAAPPNPYQRVTLGKTGIKVTLIAFGTGTHGGVRETNQTRLGKEKLIALLKAGYERGIRFFDTADKYGSHEHVAAALKGIDRDQYVLNTKIWVHQGGLPETERPDADVLLDRFRKELKTDYLDIVLLHCQMSDKWPDEQKKQMDILENLKAKKVLRAHGVSCHTFGALKAAAENPWVDVLFARINAYGTAMDAPPQEVAPLLKKAHDAGKGLMAMKLVGDGNFENAPEKIDKSIQYVMGLGACDTLVVGFEKPEQIDDFAARVKRVLQGQEAAMAR